MELYQGLRKSYGAIAALGTIVMFHFVICVSHGLLKNKWQLNGKQVSDGEIYSGAELTS